MPRSASSLTCCVSSIEQNFGPHIEQKCGPKFCSMELTQQVRDYANAGMEEKSAEFLKSRELYVKI